MTTTRTTTTRTRRRGRGGYCAGPSDHDEPPVPGDQGEEVSRMLEANSNGPMDRLKAEAGDLVGALAERTMTSVRDKVEDTVGRLTDYVEGDGGPGLVAAVDRREERGRGQEPGPVGAQRRLGWRQEERVRHLQRREGQERRQSEAEAHQHRRVHRGGRPAPARLQPVDDSTATSPPSPRRSRTRSRTTTTTRRSTGRHRSSGRTGSGKPRSPTSGRTSGSSGAPRARRGTSTGWSRSTSSPPT